MNKDKLYSHIKQAFPKLDNKALNSYCVALWSDISAWHREEKVKVKVSCEAVAKPSKASGGVRFSAEERAQALSDLLDEKLDSGEITASEIRELKDIFNLKAKDQDIQIVITDFSTINPELADVARAVEWQIEEFNRC
jgi:hypothetical protein